MPSRRVIHDPLKINLSRQATALETYLSQNSFSQQNVFDGVTSTQQLLIRLSELLALPAYTELIANLFRPILFDLCARWLENLHNALEHFIALCLLVEVHEELFPILNQLILKALPEGPLSFLNSTPIASPPTVTQLHRILLAYYRVLQINRQLPGLHNWSIRNLSQVIWNDRVDRGSRLLAIRCYSLQSGMGEAERLKMETEALGALYAADCPIHFGAKADGTDTEVDGWVLPAIEVQRVQDERNRMSTETVDYFSSVEDATLSPLESSDLSPFIANVHGILLLRSPSHHPFTPSLVPVPSSISALQDLATHISLSIPTLLTSQPSGGKALLISHLSKLLHPDQQNQVVTIHLADTSLDARGLLGSYVSSTTRPGTFDWKEGVLVRAMREGKWVTLEDVDRGSNEVLSVLKPLVESLSPGKWIGGRARMNVPGRGEVVAHDRFFLFATRSVLPARDGSYYPPTFFGFHKFYEVSLQPVSAEELQTIIDTKFPQLAGKPATAIIHLWDSIRQLPSPSSTREIGLRELEKYCHRVNDIVSSSRSIGMDVDSNHNQPQIFHLFPNPSIREELFIHARDVFVGGSSFNTSARQYAQNVISLMGEQFGFDSERQEWILNAKLAELEVEKDAKGFNTAFRVGGTRLLANTRRAEVSPSPARPFVIHKPAVMLLSRIATAVAHNEPILLTGETGTGKTSIVSHLASILRHPLISVNLSQQTESSDLIGGLKPIDARIPASSLQETFVSLFTATFSRKRNEGFMKEVRLAVNECKWKRAVRLWKESTRLATESMQAKRAEEENIAPDTRSGIVDTPRKRRKTIQSSMESSETAWRQFLQQVEGFEIQHVLGSGKFAFGFVEGPLVKALRSGQWILLDEVNLASPETLECITSLLHGPTASITLTEQGSLEPVPRHPDFRLFACMNPATDVGKKDLPKNIRSRFTEIDVLPPDADKETLLSIIEQYIGHFGDKRLIMDMAELYLAVKHLSTNGQIVDGSNHRPHFSMRTLTRALTFAADTASSFGLRRAVWEGCFMAFGMVLDSESAAKVTALAQKHLLYQVNNPQAWLRRDPSPPTEGEYFKQGPFYLEKGVSEQLEDDTYIMTPSVQDKLTNLGRIIMTGLYPVLIEGPTSSGKTSAVEYLARMTHHQFVRINNHDHTDIQEYLGSYVSDPLTGKLVFKDGLLVQALRYGYWIVLDELNLAPTDVLEALNRLLDDNRELLITETQEIVRPHPHFRLFATQNPPGLYAGRKVLSRAFRNRFLEVHFQDVPPTELETILCQRCRIAPSYGKKIVSVFHELQRRRQVSRVFESKQGFATLRDLFRWAGRDAVGYQELAENGYMLLAERARRPEDKVVVKEVIEAEMKVTIDEQALYDFHRPGQQLQAFLGASVGESDNIVWTKAMQRLYVLVCRALKFNEPILLVGETGSGKTSVCQIYADACSQALLALNCHQNTETADLIGGLRPVRNRATLQSALFKEATLLLEQASIEHIPLDAENAVSTLKSILAHVSDISSQVRLQLETVYNSLSRQQSIFEWHDGPLINAMRSGHVFLIDEISLADDSVLERLNSVLEPSRTITLAERSGSDTESSIVQADDTFKLLATMNPGGDYGKKELSPALRNRFTEIWVPPVDDTDDLRLIIDKSWKYDALKPFTSLVLDFVNWLCTKVGDTSLLGLRDILAWVQFTNAVFYNSPSDVDLPNILFHHAAHMTYLDGLGSFPQVSGYSREWIEQTKRAAVLKLEELVPLGSSTNFPSQSSPSSFQLGPFSIPRGQAACASDGAAFNFKARTSLDNAVRLLRACQLPKPILLEGSPGVGKTSLVTALAKASGHQLCRINLSDQTDLMDLFGSDLPVEGGKIGEFAWKDAEFLKALLDGHWVLLDEMNLAPQAVLEGLNAVLDHRGSVYLPELNRTFIRHPSFRIFAAQNPLAQGGGRKGLPKSFVNRFTRVYVEELTEDDLYTVCSSVFSDIEEQTLRSMIAFNTKLNSAVSVQHTFGREGSPWEFNLRDLLRWGTLMTSPHSQRSPEAYLQSIYLSRFRTPQDRQAAQHLFEQAFSLPHLNLGNAPAWVITDTTLQFGHFHSERQNLAPLSRPRRILKNSLSALEVLGDCISRSWLAIISGPRNAGKTDLVRIMANLKGIVLKEVPFNSTTDATDFLGSFEQVDSRRTLLDILQEVRETVERDLRTTNGSRIAADVQAELLVIYASLSRDDNIRLPDVNSISQLLHSLSKSSSPSASAYQVLASKVDSLDAHSNSRFAWVDGPLVHAVKSGHWLLFDGANLCNPSVLDRLNSLCEADGRLTLTERGFVNGQVQTLKPHPNFRLFMTVDPHHGELSRAMRNRGVEIALCDDILVTDESIITDYLRLPGWRLASTLPYHLSAFDAIRRGISPAFLADTLASEPSGFLLDQDSPLSLVVEQRVVFDSRPPHDEAQILATVFVASRVVVPGYIALTRRYRSAIRQTSNMDNLEMFLQEFSASSSIISKLTPVHDRSEEALGLPRSSLLRYPAYFYSSIPKKSDTLPPNEETVSALLHFLDLNASIFLYEKWLQKCPAPSQKGDELQDEVYRSITKVLFSVCSTARTILNSWNGETESGLRVASASLQLARHLQQVIKSGALNFSAIQFLCRSFLDILPIHADEFTDARGKVESVQSLVSLTTGLGLVKLWNAFYRSSPSADVYAAHQETESRACRLEDEPKSSTLRRQFLDVMSLTHLQEDTSVPPLQSISHFETDLEYCLPDQGEGSIEDMRALDGRLLVLELNILSREAWSTHCEKAFVQLISTACHDIRNPLLRLIPYQHLKWSKEIGQNSVSLLVRAHMTWLEGLWQGHCHSDNTTSPDLLFHPVQFHSTISACDLESISIGALSRYEEKIQRLAQFIIIQAQDRRSRLQQLQELYLQMFRSIFSFESPHTQTSREILLDFAKILKNDVLQLERSGDPVTVPVIHKFISPIVQKTLGDTVKDLGTAWVGLSRALFELTVPNNPIDPAAIQQYMLDKLAEDSELVSLQLKAHAVLEGQRTGNADNDIIRHLQQELKKLSKPDSTVAKFPCHRNNLIRLHSFWSEVLQFKDQAFSHRKIDALVDTLHARSQTAQAQEAMVQDSLASFCQRLDTAYPEFADITIMIKLSVLYLRLGLRLIAQPPPSQPPSSTLLPLTAYPSLRSTQIVLHTFPSQFSGSTPFQHILLVLSAFAFGHSCGIVNSPNPDILLNALDQTLGLWLIDRAKEKDFEKQSNTLYRTSQDADHGSTDAEIEEKEFLLMFPTFENSLDSNPSNIRDGGNKRYQPLIKDEDMKYLLRTHFELFGSPSSTGSVHIFDEVRRKVLKQQLLSESSMEVDTLGFPFQISFLQEAYARVHISPVTTFNFYHDPNLLECKRAISIVKKLRHRLNVILREWPDQMVLKHLIERCDTFTSLSADVPVAQMLASIEQILLQTDDWQMYANRDNSLKAEREELVNLIVTWRRLELSCWPQLLDSEARRFQNDAARWWFNLYDCLIRGSTNIADQRTDAVDQYLQELVLLLDNFITTSPVGQFDLRMRLLSTFGGLIIFAKNACPYPQQTMLERVRRIIRATCLKYGLFSRRIADHLSKRKAVLENEIKAFIKLASWKDVNVQALKQSALKSHHHLFKVIRKFRDLLREPVLQHLQLVFPPEPATLSHQPQTLSSPPNPGHEGGLSGDLPALFLKFKDFVLKQIVPAIEARPAQLVEELAVEIITTSQNLASASNSQLLPALRLKHEKVLLVRKKKAWSDLLKELKSSGLSPSLKPETLRRNTSEVWVRQQPIMELGGEDILVEKSETYFSRLCHLLPALRASLPSHHSDLTTRELQRAGNMLESGLAFAIDMRSRLADASKVSEKLKKIYQRLLSIVSTPAMVTGPNLQDRISGVADRMTTIYSSLSEIRTHALALKEFKEETLTNAAFFEAADSLLGQTGSLKDEVKELSDRVGSMPLTLISEEEHAVLIRCQAFANQFPSVLRQWEAEHPSLWCFLSPLREWLETETIAILAPGDPKAISESTLDLLIKSLQISVQTLVAHSRSLVAESSEDDSERYIIQGYESTCTFTHLLNLEAVMLNLNTFLSKVSLDPNFKAVINNVLPFLDVYLFLVGSQLTAHKNWTKSLFKLDYVISCLLQSLTEKGFCKSPDVEEGGDDAGSGEAEVTDGVGVGEGVGNENVSKDIEDESQVEGLQGEQPEKQDRQDSDDDDAIEMNDDFGGDLEDVKEAEDEGDQSGDEGDNDDIDETLGNLDNLDPSAVDEKIWGDEKVDEAEDGEEKVNKDHSKEQSGESEMAAKENKQRQGSSKEKKEQQDAEGDAEGDDGGLEEQEPDEGEGEGENPDDPKADGAPVEEFMQDANTLDLPDDLNLEDAHINDVDHEELDDSDGEMAEDETNDPQPNEADANTPLDETTQEPSHSDKSPSDDKESQAMEDGDQEMQDETDETDENEESLTAKPDTSPSDGQSDPTQTALEAGEAMSNTNNGASSGSRLGADASDEMDDSESTPKPTENEVDHHDPRNKAVGTAAAGERQGQAPSSSVEQLASNPLRSLGDTVKEIHNRFEEILNSTKSELAKESSKNEPVSQLEYLHPDDDDQDMQALGPAGEEEVAKLDQLKLLDDGPSDEPPAAMDVDDLPPSEQVERSERIEPQATGDNTNHSQPQDVAGALPRTQTFPEPSFMTSDEFINREQVEESDDLDQAVETQLLSWRSMDYPESGAEGLWHSYESLTHHLAYALCEQLRLILEPTLATRLKGDYRTGKRLNMKKIIPYIASDYAKDKIWLRRTKPSQREYQVLISIDDSRSMAESHSIHLAYQTLALISKALSRLESGDIAIAKFGETVELLHGFEEPAFTDQTGTKVLNAFRFNQKATNVLSLLENSLQFLENAREKRSVRSATAGDLWQLQFIVSDGLCQDHDKLRILLRKAEEQRVMVVFIIIDSLHAPSTQPDKVTDSNQSSILVMNRAEVTYVNGKPELQLRKYLDTFPFEYYVVLRNVEGLPDVLSATLKQFFERISEE